MPHLHKYLNSIQRRGCGCGHQHSTTIKDLFVPTIQYVCYQEWLPNVRILAPHVPDNILLDYIRLACIEFARQSRLLRRDLWLVGAGADFNLTCAQVIASEPDCDLGVVLSPFSEHERIERINHLASHHCCLHQHSWQFYPPSRLRFKALPKSHLIAGSDELGIHLSVQVVPSETSAEVDKLIYEQYFKTITDYAVAQALLVPPDGDTPKTARPNTSAFQHYLNEFQKGVARAKINQQRDFRN